MPYLDKRFYRGTPAGESAGAGKYFTGSPDYRFIRESEFVMPAELDIKNPYHVNQQSVIERIGRNPELVDELKSKGHDAAVWIDESKPTHGRSGWGNDYSQVYVFDEDQAKPSFGRGLAGSLGVLSLLGLAGAPREAQAQGLLEMLMPPTAEAFRVQGAGAGSDMPMTDEQYNEMVRMLNAR